MEKVNQLVLCRDQFDSDEEFETTVGKAVMLLLKLENVMVVRYDSRDFGIIVIEYESEDESFGSPLPKWLSPEDEETLRDIKNASA